MGGQERAPSFYRIRPLGNSIVQVLVDFGGGYRIDRRNLCLRVCSQRVIDGDADVIKPPRFRNLSLASGVCVDRWNRQRQKEHVFPKIKHALTFRRPANHGTGDWSIHVFMRSSAG
jgi:hypothetical protein